MQPGVVADQQHAADALVELSQTVDQLAAINEVKPLFEKAGRRCRKLGEGQFEGLAGAHGARAQHQIHRPRRAGQMLPDQPRRLASAFIQRPLVILDIFFPARFRVAQQVQHVHPRFSFP